MKYLIMMFTSFRFSNEIILLSSLNGLRAKRVSKKIIFPLVLLISELLWADRINSYTLTCIKPLILIVLLRFVDFSNIRNTVKNKVIKAFILISFLMILTSITFKNLSITRFPDQVIEYFGIISIYYGLIGVMVLSTTKVFTRNFYILTVLIVINASGTSLLPLIYVLGSKIIHYKISVRKKIRIISAAILLALMLIPTFYYAQVQRGRSVAEIENIDRFVITLAGMNYINSIVGLNQKFLIGLKPGSSIANFQDYVLNKEILEYLEAENEGEIYTYQLHNEYLRLFIQFGLIGTFIMILLLKRLIDNKTIFTILLLGGISNIVFSVSSIIIFAKLIGALKNSD